MTDPARAEAVLRLEEYMRALRKFVADSRDGRGPTINEVHRAREAILAPLTEGLKIEESKNESH